MEEKLLELIKSCKQYIDDDTLNEVMHFYKYGEYEMSLEGLIIEMIKIKKYPRNMSGDIIKNLVLYYHLDKESVFDYNFWERFSKWILEVQE